jgi:hypothetical protein
MRFPAIFALTALAALTSAAAAQSDPLDRSSEELAHSQWRETIINIKTPSEGCFQATFPSTLWEQVLCSTARSHTHPFPRRAKAGQPQTIGNGNDYVLVSNGSINQTTGDFPAVGGVTSESSVAVPALGGDGILGANEYSLQLNTNANETTAACSGGASECTVWQQFVYATDYAGPGEAAVFMEYWLANYGANGANCPTGYATFTPRPGVAVLYAKSCWKNSSYLPVPDVPITGLENLKLTGAVATGGNDTVTFANGTQAYSVTAPDSVLGIGTVWYQSEFNVFGDAGGSEAVFNTGTEIVVNVAEQYGATAAPTCELNDGTTAETNNLNLSPCETAGGATPAIQFTESRTWGLSSEFDAADEKVYYLGSNSNLYQLAWSGGWTWLQATGTNNRPSVVPGTQFAAYVNTIYNGDEVFYVVDSNGNSHIEQLWGSSLSPTDLTIAAGGKTLAPGTSPVGYIDPVAGTDNVFYIGTDQRVHALVWSPVPGWKESAQLDAITPPSVAVGSPLSGHIKTCSNGQVCSDEIFYIGANQHVYELWSWSQTPGWQFVDVTIANGTKPVAAAGSPLGGFNDTAAGIDAIFYLGTNQHLYELLFDSSGQWTSVDITQNLLNEGLAVALAGVGSSLTAHLNTLDQTEEVFFLDSNQNVQEFWSSSSSPSGWHAVPGSVNASSGAPPAAPGSPITGGISYNSNDHLWYIGTDNNVHEFYWWLGLNKNGWIAGIDDTQTSPVAPPAAD